jgi:uncharacterized protein (DUF1697 family)
MSVFVVMLRSINVGGRNKVGMADLRALVTSLGFADVESYVQSGNLVLAGGGTPPSVAATIKDGLARELSVSVPVIVRDEDQFAQVFRSNPLGDLDDDPTRLHVTFFDRPPAADRVATLDELAGTFGGDQVRVIGPDAYLHCPGGYGRTTLTNSFLERKLGGEATTRNWRTVTALAQMAGIAPETG